MKKSILSASLSLLATVCVASNSASTAYVDNQFAGIQTQIDAIKANPGIAHPVGSCYGGGVVFYVNPDVNAPPGTRGLIVAPSDSNGTTDGTTLITGCVVGPPAKCQWDSTGNTSVTYSDTNPSLYFTGKQNTSDILGTTTVGTWSAAQAAHSYNTINPSPTCAGCTSWYLPSQDELATLSFQSTNIASFGASCTGYNGLARSPYWSSSLLSGNPGNAWYVAFSGGGVGTGGTKGGRFGVRPVRAF